MVKELLSLDDLPRQNASQVKNKWGEVVRQVRKSGSVAVTNHAAVEMVLLDAAIYRQLAQEIAMLNAKEQTLLDDLNHRFTARLAILQQPQAPEKVRNVLAARGRLSRRSRPKAGASF